MAIADTTAPINSPICCFAGVAPTIYPVFKSWDVSPAIAATIQITVPIEIAATIPLAPVLPVAFKIAVVTINVAIAIPDTGLLLLPTIPTILDDTVAKKKPNTTIIIAPTNDTGISGSNHIATAITTIPPRTADIGMSLWVLSPASPFLPNPFSI